MKFLRYLNPFFTARRIAELEADLALSEAEVDALHDIKNQLSTSASAYRESRDRWIEYYRELGDAFDCFDRAIDAHLDERSDLIADLAAANAAGTSLMGLFLRQGVALDTADATIAELEAQLRTQAAETLEVVDYVKVVENELAAKGITVADGEYGPVIVVNQDVFLQRLSDGAFKVIREESSATQPLVNA